MKIEGKVLCRLKDIEAYEEASLVWKMFQERLGTPRTDRKLFERLGTSSN